MRHLGGGLDVVAWVVGQHPANQGDVDGARLVEEDERLLLVERLLLGDARRERLQPRDLVGAEEGELLGV